MGRKLSKMAPQRVQNGAVNYLKIMLEFFQNLFKIFKKRVQNGVPEGSRAVGATWEALLGAREASGSILGRFWGPFWDPFWS